MKDIGKIQKMLSKELDEERYQHTVGVMYTCAALAMAHSCDIDQAQIAGLLHDCAKCIPNKKKLKLCRKHGIPVTALEEDNPFLLHGKLGAYRAQRKYQVSDPAVLRAIAYHTTGRPKMSLLEKIVYLADYIEPMRDKAPNLAEIRRLAYVEIDECMYRVLEDTLDYLKKNPKDIDKLTEDAFHYYEKLHYQKIKER